jgi:ribonuclease J
LPHPNHLEIIPLGGLGEFGMNLMVYRFGRDCVIVDAGMMFPGNEHLGVDVVIPKLDFLEDCGTLHAVVLTHGHEDHIGALPFLLARRDVPVYGMPLTLGLVRHRLQEHDLARTTRLLPLPANGGPLRLGPFELETVPVAHSIPHAVMLVLRTPLGVVVHTADFKLDPAPPDGAGTDLRRLARLGEEGVLALLSDSTNADRVGFTAGEKSVAPTLDALVRGAPARVLATTFSSNTHRIQQFVDLAARHDRRLALVGSSLLSHGEVAERLGLLRVPAGLRIQADEAMDLPPERVLVVVTGSQGEPLSALARAAVNEHREIVVEEDDLVIHSARIIPGNEKSVGRMVNHLLRRGARVVTQQDAHVHVSGHPAQEELRVVLGLLRPQFLLPIHGEYRQMHAHARLARESGLEEEAVVLADSGDLVALGRETCEVVDRVPVGRVFIDATLGEVDLETLRDRRRIAGDGIVVTVVALDRDVGTLNHPPEIISRGFVGNGEDGRILEEARRVVVGAVDEATPEERTDEGLLKARIQSHLKRFLRRRTQRRPLIIPVIVEL